MLTSNLPISCMTFSSFPAWYRVLTFHVPTLILFLLLLHSNLMTIQDHLSHVIISTERGAFTVVRGPIYAVQCIEICVHSMICLGRYCSGLPLPSAGCSAHLTRAGLRHRYPGRTKCPLAERINHPASVMGDFLSGFTPLALPNQW